MKFSILLPDNFDLNKFWVSNSKRNYFQGVDAQIFVIWVLFPTNNMFALGAFVYF